MHKKTKTLLATGVAAILMATSAPALVSAQVLILPFAQATLAEAQSLLQEALNRLERAKAEGGDVAAAEAEVEAAKAAVEAMQQAEAQAAAEAEAVKAAEAEAAAKAAAEEEARKAAEAEEAAKAAEAQAAAEAEAAKAAEAEAAAKAAAEEEARKSAEAEAAAKAAEAQAAADAEAAKAAEAEAAAKAAAEEEARKAAEAEAAAKAAAEEEARKAAEQNAEPKSVPAEPAPAEPAPEAPQPAPVDPAPAEPQPEQPAPEQPAVPAEPAPAPEVPAVPQPEPPVPAPADPAPAEPQPEQPAPAEPAQVPAEPTPMPAPDPVLEKLPEPLPENAAPVLDSAKEELPPAPVGKTRADPEQPEPKPDPALQTPPPLPPVTDIEAQVNIVPVEVISAIKEPGERLTELPRPMLPPREEVVQVIDNRTIINIGAQIFINTPDSPRLVEEDDEVIIEQLPRGRTRETIVRDNGVQVVTIRNRYGDVIQRSRILPDGREVILAYAPEYDTEEDYVWRDPAYDLPPLQLNVPIREYILSVSMIEDDPQDYDEEEIYYEFLDKPPVERVERIYSVDDVKRSARVRDKVRRIDLDTLTFGFGSAEIKEDQIEKLEKVANAMLKLLEKNPGETFLIEGHTDAVGTDKANLILSDKRAEAIAEALTGAFGVPAENLTTQGYGERYLKVNSQKPEELNRRVAIRRITSLVAPVALK